METKRELNDTGMQDCDVTVAIDHENNDRRDFKKYISFLSSLRSELGQHAIQTVEINCSFTI